MRFDMNEMINTNFNFSDLSITESQVDKFFDEPLVIFPASQRSGEIFLTYLKNNNRPMPLMFCDNDKNKQGTKLYGIDVVSPETMVELCGVEINLLIASATYYIGIRQQLRNLGFSDSKISSYQHAFSFLGSLFKHEDSQIWIDNKNKIREVYNMLDDASRHVLEDFIYFQISFLNGKYLPVSECCDDPSYQYFDTDIIRLKKKEVFVDVGVLNADTSIQFAKLTNNTFSHIMLFEPDPQNYKISKERLKINKINNAMIFEEGLSNHNGTISFCNLGNGSSRIDANGMTDIHTVRLDDKLEQLNSIDPITFIKMDIEGCERDALQGAVKTIKKYKPRLAISAYHKAEDIFELPLLIREYVPEYKFHFRKYTTGGLELVLYAVIE